ncbi:MAG: T9SS type A sorting domain-containing protein [Candidatus Marinimicrobia bacterium]|nr:T9SS type A sorting domain-containing protein [Candidatus Neomarinimicrobiota bacterium]
MNVSFSRFLFFSLVFSLSTVFADITGNLKICALRVSFQIDDSESTTGDGSFLDSNNVICNMYTIDPPPHNRSYFESQLKAIDSYYRNVSYNRFGINLEESTVFPSNENDSYTLDHPMNYYNPYDRDDIQEERITFLLKDAVNKSFELDHINFSDYDLIVIFHAGIGQDFSLPFLDPTPEDIPSTFVDEEMINNHLSQTDWNIEDHIISKGIILPETQNHLFYEIGETIFNDSEEPCDFQYGLTGTFALMVGFAMELPPLWDLETGESGIGIFGLMDQGSNNGRGLIPAPPNAWSRIYAGWENAQSINPGSYVPLLSSSQNQIASIPINDYESFLIENRNNWVKDGVSIDSMQYVIWEQTDRYPNFIEVLMDSVNIQKDENGVIIDIPNYNLGLPASGFLIWHIDESVIYSGLNDYSVNSDKTHRGIDLEEADGAQDIGYMSVFLFNDPSSGYFGDMWFKGNLEYERANSKYAGESPVFSPYTFPNTNAYDGASSFISIKDISEPSDTMLFKYPLYDFVHGFPDENAHIRLVEDFNGNDIPDLFGGTDSLWFSLSDDLLNKTYFHPVSSDSLFIQLYSDLNNNIEIFELIQDSTIQTKYEYDVNSNTFTKVREWTVSGRRFPWYNYTLNDWNIEDDMEQWNNHISSISQMGTEISYTLVNNILPKWEQLNFQSISGIDLNLDASLDILALDSDGYLYAMDSEFTLMDGFPIDIPLQEPIISRNITMDSHPEIIAKSKDSTQLIILSHDGKLLHTISTRKNDQLVTANYVLGRNAVFTQSNIYLFNNAVRKTNGNEWTYTHGDWGRSRNVLLDYESQIVEDELLIRAYCYPNPVKDVAGTLRIETTDASTIDLNIYDVSGLFITSTQIKLADGGNQISEWKWNVSDIESGVYFAYIMIDNSVSQIVKIGVIH